jgi:hypothetical protein
VAYRLSSTRMSGTVVFAPHVRDDQPVPDRVAIRFGDGEHLLATHLSDPPTVDGVTLIGGGDRIDLDEPGWTRRVRVAPRDPAACRGHQADSVIGYALQVCLHLAARYRTLDLAQLALAAARTSADRRLRRWAHRHILPTSRLLAEYHDDFAMAWPLAEQLQQLSPLRLLPVTSHPCRCRTARDPYISTDDDGDWLTCPACDQPTVMIRPGDRLADLLAEHAKHHCPTDHR